MEPNVMWIPIVAIGGSFAMIVAIVWFGTQASRRRSELRANVQMKLIDKFGNANEFVQFLQSPQGQQFLEQPRRNIRERAVSGLTGALICTFIGLAFTGCGFVFHDPGFFVPGFIMLGIGVALFISFAISWRMLKQATPPSLS